MKSYVFLVFCLCTLFIQNLNSQNCCSALPTDYQSFIANAADDGILRYNSADIFRWINGDLIAGYARSDTETDWCGGDLLSRVSTDEGQTWSVSSASVIFNPSDFIFTGETTVSVRNPSFLISQDQTKMHMFFKVKSRKTDPNCTAVPPACPEWDDMDCYPFKVRVFHSNISLLGTYNAANWSTPVEISEAISGGEVYAAPRNNAAIRLSNGMIALASTVTVPIKSAQNFKSYVLFSNDEGSTWHRTALVENSSISRGLMEPEIIEVKNNSSQKIMMVMRTVTKDLSYNTIPLASLATAALTNPYSPPTWDHSNPNIPDFPAQGTFPDVASNTPVAIERLPCSGDLVMILNEWTGAPSSYFTDNNRSRNKMISLISSDEGLSWSQLLVLEKTSGNGDIVYTYPSTYIGDDNHLYITFWHRHFDIPSSTYVLSPKFRSIPLTDLYGQHEKLFAWWPGDINGTDIQGSNNGTLYGVTMEPSGRVDEAFNFDGVNDYIDVSDPVVNIPPYSIEAWVYSNPTNQISHFIMANGGETGSSHGFSMKIKNGNWHFKVRSSAGQVSYAEAPISERCWTHLTGTWDGSLNGSGVKLYVNGQLASNGLAFASGSTGPANNFSIGRPTTVANYLWDGLIDEVKIYDTELTADEVEFNFSKGAISHCKPVACYTIPPGGGGSINPNIISWWPGDVDASDIAGNNNGTLTNGAFAGMPGYVDGSFYLDGTDDYVSVSDPIKNTPPYSIEAWVNVNEVTQVNQFIVTNGGETSSSYGFSLSLKNGNWRFKVSELDIPQTVPPTPPTLSYMSYAEYPATTTGWTHLIGTWDGSLVSEGVNLYVNGICAATGSAFVNQTAGTASNLYIGRPVSYSTSYLWNGWIDEVTIYDDVLSQDHIQSLYQTGIEGKCKNVTGSRLHSPKNEMADIHKSENTISSDNIKILPNPSNNGRFTIVWGDLKVEDVKIYSNTGQFVKSVMIPQNENEKQLFLDKPKGVYLLMIQTQNQIVYRKIVIQ